MVNTFEDVKVFPVQCKDGRVVLGRNHTMNLNGRCNRSKVLTLILLYHQQYDLHQHNGLRIDQIHLQSGLSAKYLKIRLCRWLEWGYVLRTPAINDMTNRPCYAYKIATRGKHVLLDIIPREKLREYEQQIRQYQRSKGGTTQ